MINVNDLLNHITTDELHERMCETYCDYCNNNELQLCIQTPSGEYAATSVFLCKECITYFLSELTWKETQMNKLCSPI